MTQLPLTPPLLTNPPRAMRLRPKSYTLAVIIISGVLLLEVAMLISVFYLRAMIVMVKVDVPKAQGGGTNPTVYQPPLPNLPSPTNAGVPRLTVPSSTDKLEQVGNLNDQAEAFQHLHAMTSAIETLLKAEDIDPRNPTTLKNLAETYKLTGDQVRSKIYWQRLVDLGPAVGTVYAVAKDQIVLLDGTVGDPLTKASPMDRKIYISQVEKTPVETVNAEAQFRVRATLQRKDPKMPLFDQKKLQPYVIFYQQMPDRSLVPDLNQHKGAFEDTFLFWSGKTSETFGVSYLMPLPGTLGPNKVVQGEYYGFVIGIYYDKVLQDARSEPSSLINRIPLPDEIE